MTSTKNLKHKNILDKFYDFCLKREIDIPTVNTLACWLEVNEIVLPEDEIVKLWNSRQETKDNKQVADTILDQLGGNKFLVMTGAQPSFGTIPGLYLTLPNKRNLIKAKYIKIELNSKDLYDLSFMSLDKNKGLLSVSPEDCQGIYCDQLVDVIQDKTGLSCYL